MCLLESKNLYRVVVACIIVLCGCKSTTLNKNLGTQVSATGTQIEFSWQDNHPFAKQYGQQNITLIAEYMEISHNGQVKPVHQLLSTSNNRLSEINKKVFVLPQHLSSIPNDPKVCLYLQLNRQAIPIRAAGSIDTARFSYPQWQQLVANNTSQQILSKNLSIAEKNLATAQNNIDRALAQQNQAIDDFNQQLLADSSANKVTVYEAQDCQNISVKQSTLVKPKDVVTPKDRKITALNICTARAHNSVKYVKQINKKKIPAVKLLPFSSKFNRENLTTLISKFDDNRKGQFKLFQTAYQHFLKNSVRHYQPALGSRTDLLPISDYNFQLQTKAFSALMSSSPMSEQQLNIVNEAFSNELEEFKSCVVEGQGQLKTKYDAWQIRKSAHPNRIKARKAYLVEKCDTLFAQNATKLRRMKKQEEAADTQLMKIQQQSKKASQMINLPTEKLLLNNQVCKI